VVAAQIPARRAADCDPDADSEDCYVWAAPEGPLQFRIVRPPAHGTAVISNSSGNRATAVYTATGGYSGSDSFEYTATDARGLESPPALVQVDGPPGPAEETVRRRLVAGFALRRRGERWFLVVRLDASARVRGRLERRGSPYRLVRRIRPRLRPAGRRRIALGELRRGRYRLRLRFAAADGRRAALRRRFRVRAP
jgi:Bacterial Ig domain